MSFKDLYLARAREAEEMALTVTDPHTREVWLRIAAGYHDMVAKTGTLNTTHVSQQQQQPQPGQGTKPKSH